jgi:cobalt-zinc-cadmium efflux system outer membrane protein
MPKRRSTLNAVWFRLAVIPPLVLSAGCVSFEPEPILPEHTAAELQERSLDDPSLRTFFDAHAADLTADDPPAAWGLAQLTLAAFYFHPELDVARAQWAVAEAARVTAGGRPSVAVGVTPGRNTTTPIPSPTVVTATVDLTLETAGKRGYRIAEATQLAEAARLNVATIAWQVRTRVRSSFLDLYAALESQRLLGEQQRAYADLVGILEGQFAAGAISSVELILGRLAADTAKLDLSDAERQEAEARARLAGAVGVPGDALNDVNFSFAEFESSLPAPDTAQARQRALLNRPDVLGALADYAASQSALQLAIARQYPDIGLGPGYEYDQGDNKWSLGLAISLPPDRNRGPIAEARARRAEAAARFTALQASVLERIDVAVAGYRAALRKQADANAMHADLVREETVARGMLEAGALSGADLAALKVQLGATAIASLDASVQAWQAAGAVEDAIQDPSQLPSAVWEQAPRSAEP